MTDCLVGPLAVFWCALAAALGVYAATALVIVAAGVVVLIVAVIAAIIEVVNG